MGGTPSANAPEPLLVERRIETADDVSIARVTADGGVWAGGTVRAQLTDDEWRHGRRDEPWSREGTLQPEALEALRRAIADSGFFATEAEHRASTPVIHASSETWTAELDGRRHTITNHARGVVRVPALLVVDEALEAALAGLRQVNLAGVIVGKALYEKRFTVAEGQAALDSH